MEDNNLKNQFSADLLGAVSKVLGEAEQIDEVSSELARSYLKANAATKNTTPDAKKENRRKGGWNAFAKLHKQPHAKVHATEEVEPIDELSKDFLRTKYIPAARKNMEKQSELGDIKSRIAYNLDNPEVRKNMHKTADSHFKKSKNRMSGIETAKDRLKNSFYDKPSDRKKQSVKEEVSLDEKHGGADYAIYHKSYTDAVDHALSHHGKSGLSVSDDDRFHHIGLMSKKPSEGNTTTLNLPAKDHATGKDHTIHMQVYNRGGSHPYELNTYSSKNSTQRQIDRVAAKRKKALGEETIEEKLIGNQTKLDHDGDGKLEKSDFKKLRNKKIAAKMKDKDCACDDDDKMDEAVYNGHRPTGLPPGQGLPKAQQDALTAKLRDFDAKMDAAKKKFATKEEVELDEAKFKAPHDDSFVQSIHPRTGPEAKFYHKNGMIWRPGSGNGETWRVRFGNREKGDLDKSSNESPKRYRSMEKAKAALIAGKPVKEETTLDEGTVSHTDLAQAAHKSYVQATRLGNGTMAAHYLKQHKKHKDLAAKEKAVKEEVEPTTRKRGRPAKPGSAAYIAQQKAKEAGEAEGPEPDEHIMNQVRKAADSGMMPHKIKYADGSTHALHRVHARAVIAKYNRLKPFAKEDMQAEIAKSHEHMMKHAKD